ncbi:MAG: hypothetical protein NTZ22_01460 [Hyphomicrobiales bacterium]|jgi:hypothetical protein|nr:hypothetical protein [Hyphomicrobiales bacterium]
MSDTQPQVLVIKQFLDESIDAFELRIKHARDGSAQAPDPNAAPLIIYSVPLSLPAVEHTTAFA